MQTRFWLAAYVSLAVIVLGGCVTDTPVDNPDDTSATGTTTGAGSNTSNGDSAGGSAGDTNPSGTSDTDGGSGTSDSPAATLSSEEEELAKMLAAKQTRLMAVLGALSIIAEDGTIPSEDGVTHDGVCPVIDAERDGDAVALQLDYGNGCQVAQSASGSFAGVVLVVVDYETPNFTSTFNGISVDGHTYSGFVGPAVFQPQRASATLAGSITIDDEDTESTAEVAVTGDVTAVFDKETGAITISAGSVFFTRELDSYDVTIANVVCNSTVNGTFVPESGTITATALDSTTLSVTFDSTSPGQNRATASVNGGEAITFDLE